MDLGCKGTSRGQEKTHGRREDLESEENWGPKEYLGAKGIPGGEYLGAKGIP